MAILNLSHQYHLTNEVVDEFQEIITHHIGKRVIPCKMQYQLQNTPIQEYVDNGQQLLILFGPDTGEPLVEVHTYADKTYP